VRRLFQSAGTTYVNGLVSTPLCCPSRSSLFAGRYSHNTGVLGNGFPEAVQAFDQEATIQGYLQDAGYRTALVGKYLTTVPLMESPRNWDRWAHTTGGYVNVPFNVDGQYRSTRGYVSQYMTSFSREFLQDFEATDDQPWLLYVAPQAPHWDYTPAPKYRDAPVPEPVKPPSWNEPDTGDKPPWVQWTANVSEAEYLKARTKMLQTLMSVDDMAGAIFRQMNQLDETRDTLAIFMSDNGYLWAEHGLTAKRYPYLESSEVPFIVRWPGRIAAGAESSSLVAQIDVLPTVLEAAGLAPQLVYPLDGQSLLSPTPRTEVLQEYHKSNDSSLRPWASIRGEMWQYVEWYDSETGDISFREYYDLGADPYQLVNLLRDGDDTNNPAVPALHDQLTAARVCSGETCP
jgi:arylsulfatase A-like enzyme